MLIHTVSSSRSTRALRNRTKVVRSGVGSDDQKPQKRRNEDLATSRAEAVDEALFRLLWLDGHREGIGDGFTLSMNEAEHA